MTMRGLDQDAVIVAPRLLGCIFEVHASEGFMVGRIVETEAYTPADAASHSYRGITSRTKVMFGPPGRLYVYFTYGMHHCCNVTTGPEGEGAAVLIRAIEPTAGLEVMQQRRHGKTGYDLTNGPAKVCQAFGITLAENGHDLSAYPIRLREGSLRPGERISRASRIGITKNRHAKWRFYIHDNPYVSRTS